MRKLGLIFSLLIMFSALATAQPVQNQSSADPGLVPGDLFYPVESFAENLEVKIAGLIGGPDFKAKALANNAEESLTEASRLAEQNRFEEASEMAEKYYNQMNSSRTLAESSKNSNLSKKIEDISRKNVDRLEKVKEKVPEQAKKGIEKALQKQRENRETGQNPGKNKGKPSEEETGDKPGKSTANISDPSPAGKASDKGMREIEDLEEEEALNRTPGVKDFSESQTASNQVKDSGESENGKTESPVSPVRDEGSSSSDEIKASESSDEGGLDENPVNETGKGLR